MVRSDARVISFSPRQRAIFLSVVLAAGSGVARPIQARPPDTREASQEPAEIYGPARAMCTLRVGNGGAGPTGLLRALAEDFLAQGHAGVRVAWFQNITRLNLDLLRSGELDVALTYEPELEAEAVRAGWAGSHTLVFVDHFLLVGPLDDPAQVGSAATFGQAFARIAALGRRTGRPTFLSRHDRSGTNQRERALWRAIAARPWVDAPWYITHARFPRETLAHAERAGLYTLTDRGTWLAAPTMPTTIAILRAEDSGLLNPCHALTAAQPSALARQFVAYLAGPRGQALIATFGQDGTAYFDPAAGLPLASQ